MCMKIYALKPFEADVGYVSPAAELSTLSTMATADGRGTSGDVTLSPADDVIARGLTSSVSDTKL